MGPGGVKWEVCRDLEERCVYVQRSCLFLSSLGGGGWGSRLAEETCGNTQVPKLDVPGHGEVLALASKRDNWLHLLQLSSLCKTDCRVNHANNIPCKCEELAIERRRCLTET